MLEYDQTDPDEVAFIDDATRYYQVYDAHSGRLLTQSPGMESLGLHYTPAEVAEFRAQSGAARRPHRPRPAARVELRVISPAAGEAYLVQVGELLDGVDRTLVGFDRLLWLWRSSAACWWRRCSAGGWRAAPWRPCRAWPPPLRRSASATCTIGCRCAAPTTSSIRSPTPSITRSHASKQSVGEMRQFSAALAHELRTPLAILRGEAELALAHPLVGRRPAGAAREPDRRVRSADPADQPDPDAGAGRGRRDRAVDRSRSLSAAWRIGDRADRAGRRARAASP